MKLKFLAAIGFAAILYACDDATTGIGDFVADADEIKAYSETYDVTTNSVLVSDISEGKGVYSRTNNAYLGKFTDPGFGEFSADFITQINCPEGFEFPKTLKKITSTTLELYYKKYYGDSLAPMRVGVTMLAEPINDDGKNPDLYYTSFDPKTFTQENTLFAEKDYSPYDNSIPDSVRFAKDDYGNLSYYPCVKIDMDKPYGGKETFSEYLKAKYDEVDANGKHVNFKDAATFINNVLKGFYVNTTKGEGSVLYIEDIWLRTNFEYTVKSSKDEDSTVYASNAFAATKEIYMATNLRNNNKLNDLKNDADNTYLKTPAGIWTEVTLPLDQMYEELKNDTLNSVSLTFTKYKESIENGQKNTFKMGTPQNLLLIRKGDLKDFFEQNKTFDSQTSFLATYDSSTGTYTFSKLNRLISYIFSEIRNNKAKNDDWDKLLLIPVKTQQDSQGEVIGVSHDLEVNSARLFGGLNPDNKLKMEVIYTKPNERYNTSGSK